MSVVEFLSRLADLDIRLWVEGGNLRFSAPEGAFTDEIKQDVISRKAELIEFLSQARKVRQEEIPPANRTQNLPLSYAQQRLWFLYKLEPDSAAYNMPAAIRIRGKLSIDILQRVICEVCQRHEILRTVYLDVDNEATQVIQEAQDCLLTSEALQRHDAESLDAALIRLAGEEAYQPFNLRSGPVLRTRLFDIADDDYIFLATLHHIAADGWSMGVLVSEIATLYKVYSEGHPSPLPALKVQYADYAAWQRSHIGDDKLAKQLQYWQQQLDNTPSLALPADRARPPIMGHDGDFHRLSINRATTTRLNELSREAGATPFMTLLCAYAILLARYSQADDFAIGSPIANREHSALEPLIGCFINTLAIRVRLHAGLNFQQLLEQVTSTSKDAFAHQDVPFEYVVEKVVKQRDLSSTPLFQAMFILQNAPSDRSVTLPGVTLEPVEIGKRIAKCDLSLCITEEEDQLQAEFEYRTDLFDAATIARMGRHFIQLLESICRDSRCPVNQLRLLDQDEQRELLEQRSGRKVAIPNITVHQLFEQQVVRTPQAIAVVCGDHQLSYQALNQQSNQLANYLMSQGVKPGDRIGICLPPATDILVAVLAALKCGAAYIPMDPKYPDDRLAHMIDNADMAALISHSLLAIRFAGQSCPLLCINEEQSAIDQESDQNINLPISAEALLYVVYTSGSTGKPKGAGVRHRNEVNLLQWYVGEYGIDGDERVLIISAFGFDLTQKNLFAALTCGGRIQFIDSEHYDHRIILDTIAREQITLLNCAPSAFYPLVEHSSAGEELNSLRTLLFGGEAIRMDCLQPWIERSDFHCTIGNMYGPTECTDIAATYTITQPKDFVGQIIPIGKANDNVQLCVLDDCNQLVPDGIVGELCIGGAGVGIGYLNNPAMTGQAFFDNPFGEGKLYRTGDLVRCRNDGLLEFVSRIDGQVKIRGFRIELGEIESQIARHPAIREAVVAAVDNGNGQKVLVGYYTADNPQHTPDQQSFSLELRSRLKQVLPDYMVPVAYIPIADIPLNANGKVNRDKLPRPDLSRITSAPYEAPKDDTERAIALIWQQVLQRDKIGRHDNFFEVGGHSLLATQVITRLSEHFDRELPLRLIFEQPSVSGMARALSEQTGSDKIRITPVSRTQPLALSFAQQRLWIINRLQPDSAVYNIPLVFQISRAVNETALQQAFSALIERHETLRTTLTVDGKDTWQTIHPAQTWPLQSEAISGDQAAIEQRIKAFAGQPFDLLNGPLLRTALLAPDDREEYLLLICLHHIIADGWSVQVLMRDLLALYQQHQQFDAQLADNNLPALPIQYADYAAWQRDYLSGERLERQINYWRKQLSKLSDIELPTDRPHAPVIDEAGGAINFEIDASLSHQLRQLSRQQGVTLFITLLAAFQLLLSRYCRSDDIAVGSTAANRHINGTDKLIGFFVNTIVLRSQINQQSSFIDILTQVKQTVLDGLEHQDLPFERLVDELNVPRNMSRTPLFQVMFTLLGALESANNAPHNSLELQSLRLNGGQHDTVVKFDLALGITDRGEAEPLQASIEYRTQLFDCETIERLCTHLLMLLKAVTTDPAQAVCQIDFMPESERSQILIDWNQTGCDYPDQALMHHLIETQAARNPDAVAVCDDSQSLSYRELNQQANQLAHHLIMHGVGPDVMVGVAMERCVNMSVALLAVLKAGGAYVPFDPSFPPDRLGFMLEDTEVAVILTQSHLQGQLPVGTATVLRVDTDQLLWADASLDNPAVLSDPDKLFNVIFTSGSTGKPKGVMVPHRGIVNRLHWMQKAYPIDSSDRILQKTPYSFDVSVWELFWPLMVGAQIVYAKPDGHKDPQYLRDLIQREHITTLHFVPSMLGIFLQTEGIDACHSIHRVFCSGEALQLEHEQRFFERLPGKELHNLYGPTEASVDVSWFACNPASHYRSVPIGKPVDNTQLYVLDEQLQAVPIGVVGELYIGGVQLARGYLKREELTASTFIPNPLHQTDPIAHPSPRLYKTGDLVRYLADGNIEYIGRVDFQVKVRGLRIELGEIETVLHRHPLVRETIVITRDFGADGNGSRNVMIIAYVVPEKVVLESVDLESVAPKNVVAEKAALSDTQRLRKYLAKHLPAYMIPNVFVMLDEIPLSPNGKANRKALPEPDLQQQVSAEYIAPNTETEIALCEIWKEVLRLEKIGIQDNFFEMGGHSLLATQAMALVHARFHIEIELRKVFEQPTIESIAALIDQALAEKNLLLNDMNDANTDVNDIDDDEEELVI